VGTRALGQWGEEIANGFLADKGYALVERGFRSRFGEIDLIVKDGAYIVFVEVKLRKNAVFAQAREFVGKAKQGKIRATARIWLASHRTGLQPRFDVIEVYAPDGAETKKPVVNHIENAF
jgi:putative endonuclease